MKSSLKLSREMKLALTGAALAGAVGGWYAWNSSQVASEPIASAPPSTAGTAPTARPASGGTTPANAQKGVTVTTPKTPVKVEQVPFLTAQAATPATKPAAKPEVAASTGPDNDLPNPFQPFSVQKAPAGGAPSPSVASGTLPAPSVPNTTPVSRPSVVSVPKAVTPPLAGTIPLPSANVSGAAPFPGAASQPLVVKPGLATGTAPVRKPPTPTVRAPATASFGTLPVLAGAASGTGASTGGPSSGSAQAAASAQAAVSAASESVPGVAVVPPLLTEIQGVAGTAAINPLDAYVADQNLSYNAVVLGPVNTGIFQTKTGYVVVSIGQKMPGSDIVVTDITASGVTLALGDSQKTLELDKR